MPDNLTIPSIINAFRTTIPSSELCTNKKFIIFESLCDLLSTYINPEDDITQLLYVLYDMERILCKSYGQFPSEELYWRCKDVNESREDKEKLIEAFRAWDYEAIRMIILKDMPDKKKKEVEESGLIGAFCFENNHIKSFTLDKRYGMVLGNQIVYNTNIDGSQGMVSYDCCSDRYYVTSACALSNKDKMQIIKDYKLPGDQYMFVVQRREENDQ